MDIKQDEFNGYMTELSQSNKELATAKMKDELLDNEPDAETGDLQHEQKPL